MNEEIKTRLLPTGVLEDIEEERKALFEQIAHLRVNFEKPFEFITDYLKLQSDISALESVLNSHLSAVSQIEQEADNE